MMILCIGDSNTYGYDPRSYIGSRYPENVYWTGRLDYGSVLNCGMNGLSVPTDGKAWCDLIESRDPDLITVMLGSNDLLEGRSAEETTRRMENFLKSILCLGKGVLLIAPPILKPGAWVQTEELVQESCKMGQLYRNLARKLGTDFADAGEWNIEMSFDGVHFTEAGHKIFAQCMENHLEEIY